MSNTTTTRARDACPHCGRPARLSWWNLLPSRDNNRVLTCQACSGHFDLSNACKMRSILGGMLGMALAMAFPFQWLVRAGQGSKGSVVAGIAVAAASICVAAVGVARLTLELEAKP